MISELKTSSGLQGARGCISFRIKATNRVINPFDQLLIVMPIEITVADLEFATC